MAYWFIQQVEMSFPVMPLCRALRVSRSAYYAGVSVKSYTLPAHKTSIAQQVKTIFDAHLKR